MTIHEFVVKHLTDNGMFPDQASAVFAAVETDKANESMAQRWNDQVEDYPKPLFAVILLVVNRKALDWIESNLPQAWFKPMFMTEEDRSKFLGEELA